MHHPSQMRTYNRGESITFRRTAERYGGLSNMAPGFPIWVNGVRIYTSEALHQACRHPRWPELQRLIISQASPMTAKIRSRPYRQESRPDWDRSKLKVMRWCLRVKLAWNWDRFSQLLLVTESRPIVEESPRDDYWGAKPVDGETLIGINALGRLLMELREEIRGRNREEFLRVNPIAIPDFLLFGEPIGRVDASLGQSSYLGLTP